ncbi:IS21-like element helper ATPase IstB [Haliangium ochraceum]|uniref:IstB domain protein ATP-binding protein n=1 Tax=Haliangium ochraceum (strain DSM 14365 / JCM 11303 / SMP-2) TaxID=502025 RepID=D0LPU2_HALO1|nr:IS21-like element helper ATPase IstB [Haliangium ochraceum]ACY15455.1 IstB domain protein ATP-binding protein [Haliangium ochraceum DSM 14365]
MTPPTLPTAELTPDELHHRVRALGLYGVLARWDELRDAPWLPLLAAIEEAERQRRSLERRLRDARIGAFKPLADFDWSWPRSIDRQVIEELATLAFLKDGTNVILVGPNGVGKTMLLKNLAHLALIRGHSVRFMPASDMLADLAKQSTSDAFARRLRRFTGPALLCIDEVGYLSYDSRYADLLFRVVSDRYDAGRSIILSTNKAFSDWTEVFPHATCTVTLVDRLVHRSEILEIDGDSFRLKEAKERQAHRSASRRPKRSSQ